MSEYNMTMDQGNLFLGIDIGTTAVKIGLISDGKLLYDDLRSLKTYRGEGGSAYQQLDDIIGAVKGLVLAIPQLYKEQIGVLSFSVAMHSTISLDGVNDNIVRIWSDRTAEKTIKSFVDTTDQAVAFYKRTGTPIHSMTPFARILHGLHSNHGDYKWIGIKEAVMKEFCGDYWIDRSTAAATGLMDGQKFIWDKEILNYLGVSEQQLGKIVSPTTMFSINETVSKNLGLPKTAEMMIGGSDGVLAAYAGYMSSGIKRSLTIGTSMAVRKLSSKWLVDPSVQNFCYGLSPDLYVCGLPSNNGGCVLEWLHQTMFQDATDFYGLIDDVLNRTEAGANDLQFLPYINGERAPFWTTEVHGSFSNVSITHTREDFLRAIIEGLLFNARFLQDKLGVDRELPLSVSGGFFNNQALIDLAATVFHRNIVVTPTNEPLFGLYHLYQQAAKVSDSVENLSLKRKLFTIENDSNERNDGNESQQLETAKLLPATFNPEKAEIYDQLYDHFKKTIASQVPLLQ
ncbi:MAG: FGGY family carbohydrate kinase [Bavariicoccus seileri]